MKRVVMSVPHSGTRSLVNYLGIDQYAQGLLGGRYWHFVRHDELLEEVLGEVEINIPIRHPLDVANGWASRPKPADAVNEMVLAFDLMFNLIHTQPVKLHRIEDIPHTEGGRREHLKNPDPQRIQLYKNMVTKHVLEPHKDFYGTFYPELAA